MNITSIEVIKRNNPGVAVGAVVGEKLPVEVGDTVRIHMTVDYRGLAIDGAVWTAIGWQVGVVIPEFIETFNSRTPVHFDESVDFVTYPIVCEVDILTLPPAEEILYGTLLDMYAKIMEVPGPDIFTPTYKGVIAWGKPVEEYELIQHTVHHFAYIYEGEVETTIVAIKTDPFKPADWVPEGFIAELEREARESGVRVLETKVYADTSPLFWTDYRVEVIGRPPPGAEGVGVGALPAIPLFVKIILTALAIAFGIFVISWAIEKAFSGIFQRKPGLEDVKPGWGKEALILDIQDSEEFWERTPTPLATLEEMSEAELRDHLDKIAEEEVPPEGVGLGLLVAVGAVGVVGVGLALAMAPRAPRE